MAKYSRRRSGGYSRRRGYKKAYSKRRRYGKSRVPAGTRLVRGALRTGGSYAVGQARAELKYCDSLLYNVNTGTNPISYATQSKAQAAGSQPNTLDGDICLFGNYAAANGAPYAGTNGQPGMLLNNITLGTDATQRIGRKVQIKSIRLLVNPKVQISSQTTQTAAGPPPIDTTVGVAQPQTVRIVLVWDKQPNGVQATSTDVFVDMNATTGSSAMMQLNNRDRFVIIADEKRTLAPFGNAATVFDIYKECDLTTIYSSGPNPQTISSIASGALYAFFLGDYPEVGQATQNPYAAGALDAQCRIRYLDA